MPVRGMGRGAGIALGLGLSSSACRVPPQPVVQTPPPPEPVAVPTHEPDAIGAAEEEAPFEPSLEKGQAFLKQGEFGDAHDHCEEILLEDEDNVHARHCTILAYVGLHRTLDAYSTWQAACDPDDLDGCSLGYGVFIREAGYPLLALQEFVAQSLLVEGEDNAAALEQEIIVTRPLVEALIVEAAIEVTGADYRNAQAVGARAFRRILAKLATDARGEIQPLIHPDLGLFIVHNIPGHIAMLDNVHRWPKGDYDYAGYIGGKPVKAMQRATRWGSRVHTRMDGDGCVSVRNAAGVTSSTSFDEWTIQFGSWHWAVPEQLWLTPEGHEELEVDGLDAKRHAAMRTAALAITHTAIVDGLRFDFGRIDDVWYLLAMDISDDFCG